MNTTKLLSPLVAISAFLMLSYSVAYAIFLPSVDLSSHITEDVLNSINAYAPIAEFLILLMTIVTSVFMFWVAIFNIHVRRSLFQLMGLRHCGRHSSNKIHMARRL
ncbi:hypothetical protein Tcan_05044 [Toxocara canis]|uniref:Uncharacterized protein n=1 Tax=Toxocara canis TaxID=6265 RepID=A0A0B2V259_TOXCA|nr:hypothetical protein Tcan_05044 [Toxocara canis]